MQFMRLPNQIELGSYLLWSMEADGMRLWSGVSPPLFLTKISSTCCYHIHGHKLRCRHSSFESCDPVSFNQKQFCFFFILSWQMLHQLQNNYNNWFWSSVTVISQIRVCTELIEENWPLRLRSLACWWPQSVFQLGCQCVHGKESRSSARTAATQKRGGLVGHGTENWSAQKKNLDQISIKEAWWNLETLHKKTPLCTRKTHCINATKTR